jgi:hypothetical protein
MQSGRAGDAVANLRTLKQARRRRGTLVARDLRKERLDGGGVA